VKYTLAAFVALTGVLLAVPTADAGNCHVGFGYKQQAFVQQAYVAPTYGYSTYQNYSTVVPYAIPTVVVPDTLYRVDSALAYARIAEAAAEAAVNKQQAVQNQQLLQLFNEFLKQQAQLQQGQKIPPATQPPEVPKAELPPVPHPPGKEPAKGQNEPPAARVQKFLNASCVACHGPNNPKRWQFVEGGTHAAEKLKQGQVDEVMFRVMAPDDHEKMMPPLDKKKPRPTTIEDINAVHALRDVAAK
jgi:hypothetical protein